MLEGSAEYLVFYGWFVVANAALLLVLALRVSWIRIFHKVPFGDGEYRPLQGAIRAHANGVEHFPVFALVTLVLIFLGEHTQFLLRVMFVFTLARAIHAYGMLFKQFNLRRTGAVFTYLAHLVVIVLLVNRLWS